CDQQFRLGPRVRAASQAEAGLCRSGRWMGTAFHVPDGPFLPPAPVPFACRGNVEAAERIRRAERLFHLPGRCHCDEQPRYAQSAAAALVQRLSAFGCHLALEPAADRRADPSHDRRAAALDRARQSYRMLQPAAQLSGDRMQRIPPLPREEWTDEAREVFYFWGEPGAWENGSKVPKEMVMAQHPKLAMAFHTFGKFVLLESA